MTHPKQRITFPMKERVCLLCLVHQTSWIMVLITIVNESNLQVQEPAAQVLGRISSVATTTGQSGRHMHGMYTE